MKKLTFISAIALLCSGCVLLDTVPRDEAGEEVFDGDYQPVAAGDAGAGDVVETATSDAFDTPTPLRFMTAHFIDVGQGTATLLEFPCGVAVIDTGGEYEGSIKGGQMFIDYMDGFFRRRPELDKTIDVVMLSHPHADHINGAALIYDREGNGRYKVRNVVDNGQGGTKGSLGKQQAFREAAKADGAGYSAVKLSRQITSKGMSNAVIDPFPKCEGVDPKITAYWGHVGRNSTDEPAYKNPNDHSVVVRVDFGAVSFLFPGDLEEEGRRDMMEQFRNNKEVFDVDVYHVSHHSAKNGTDDNFIKDISPRLAIISMGGDDSQQGLSYGHPTKQVVELLQEEPFVVDEDRPRPRKFWVRDGKNGPQEEVTIEKNIYATGWEKGTIRLKAGTDGSLEIVAP